MFHSIKIMIFSLKLIQSVSNAVVTLLVGQSSQKRVESSFQVKEVQKCEFDAILKFQWEINISKQR